MKTTTIQQYLDALREHEPSVTRGRTGLIIVLDTDLDARLNSARDPDDDEYDPSGDVEQDIREEIAAALGDLTATIIIDEDRVSVEPDPPADTARLRGDHALILADFSQIYCGCGTSLWEGDEAGIGASSFDPCAAMPHFDHRAAAERDLAHVCAWSLGECPECPDDLPLVGDHECADQEEGERR